MNFSDLLAILSAVYMWFISALPNIATLVVAIVTYYSFAYERKPIINIESKLKDYEYTKLKDYEFTIKNLGKNPAKNITIEIKLYNNGKSEDIGKYELIELNPESEDVINLSEKVNSILEQLNLLIKVPYRIPKFPDGGFVNNVGAHLRAIEDGKYKEDELQTLHSYKVNENFKISIKFEVTCNSDNPLNIIHWVNKYSNLYDFEISYTIIKLIREEDPDTVYEINYGYWDNFSLCIRPSVGKWIKNS